MSLEYNYEKQQIIRRSGEDQKIQSIKPIYDKNEDAVTIVNEVSEKIKSLSLEFPGVKFQAEINAIPEQEFGIIKDDLSWKGQLTDHGRKCFYQPTINSVLILHQSL